MGWLALIAFIFNISTLPCYGVYLEYEDDKDNKARCITVYFADTDNDRENIRRIHRVLDGTGLSFTETERIPGTYQRRNQCFFISQSAAKFIEWIQASTELRSLKFFGVNEMEDIESIKNAFTLIAKHHRISALADEFTLIEESPTTTFQNGGFEMQTVAPQTAKVSDDIWKKFNHVEITCSGTKALEARRAMRRIIAERYKEIEDKIIVKD